MYVSFNVDSWLRVPEESDAPDATGKNDGLWIKMAYKNQLFIAYSLWIMLQGCQLASTALTMIQKNSPV